jgi:bacterioferritin-associated ferredoxin
LLVGERLELADSALSTNQEVKSPSVNTKNTNPADEVMCNCSGTTRGNIQSLFEQGLDMDAISRRTGAISGCGGCEWDISQFLHDLAEQ